MHIEISQATYVDSYYFIIPPFCWIDILSLSYVRYYYLCQNKLKQLLNGNEEFASNLVSLGDETSIDFGEMPLSIALFLSIIIKTCCFSFLVAGAASLIPKIPAL